MFDPQKAKVEFEGLAHDKKIWKVKEILEMLSKKSDFFADLYNHFKDRNDIADNVVDYLYNVVMDLVYNKQEGDLSKIDKVNKLIKYINQKEADSKAKENPDDLLDQI